MTKSQGKIKLNILAINFPSEKFEEIREIIERHDHYIDFCTLEDSRDRILRIFPDYIIAAVSSRGGREKKILEQLVLTADDLHIPFVIIETQLSENKLFVRVNRAIAEIITSPFGKNYFFKYIDKIITALSDNNRVKLNNDPSIMVNSLLTGLISQKRLDIDSIGSSDTELEIVNRHQANEERRKVEASLWTALENKNFRLFYQPVISLKEDRISGFEALIRLIGDDGSIISPDKFISVAEESAIIFPLGLWIIEETCRQINEWKEKFDLDSPLRVNVNISPRQFIFPNLTASIFEITEKYNVDQDSIAFEITESALMGDMESANMALLEFKSRNFILYMDDFGTGYSSLSYLMHFPVNIIKIDQSFVKWMHIDDQSEIIVKSIISLAHNLGLKVVAEGTDDESHISLLKDFGCDYAQGYFFSRPLPPADAEKYLEKYFKKK